MIHPYFHLHSQTQCPVSLWHCYKTCRHTCIEERTSWVVNIWAMFEHTTSWFQSFETPWARKQLVDIVLLWALLVCRSIVQNDEITTCWKQLNFSSKYAICHCRMYNTLETPWHYRLPNEVFVTALPIGVSGRVCLSLRLVTKVELRIAYFRRRLKNTYCE